MPNQLIFGPDAEECRKDIVFFASDTGLVIQVVYFTMDTCLMQACPDMFRVCNRCFQNAWSVSWHYNVNRQDSAMQTRRNPRL